MESTDNNRLAAIEAILERSAIDAERRNAEFAEQMKQSQAEFAEQMKQSQVAADVEMQKIRAEFADQMKQSQVEFDRKSDALNKQIKEVNQQIGGVSKSNGLFAEEYFFNSFDNGKQTFFGERFDVIKKNLKGTATDDEFDVVMLNGHSVSIVEVKYKARGNDISKVLNKAVTFRENFPYYANHRVYLGYATLAFDKDIEQECINQGIAIIKQVGDTVVINDKHLKVF